MMPPLPPMQMSSSASASAKGGDGAFGGSSSAIQQGDWNVNFGNGSIATSSTNWLVYGAIAAGVWWLARRRKAA